MRGRRLRVLLATGVLAALAALALSACGGAQDAAQSGQDSNDPCQGVSDKGHPHDHVFYRDGRFASVDQDGEFVDDGHYKFANDRTIKFQDPPNNLVHFRFSDDRNTVTFDVVQPNQYRVAVFYPGLPWKRVPLDDLWPGEEISEEISAKGEKENPLVGTWRRVTTCEEYVRELKQAGLAEKIPGHQVLVEEFGTGQ
jgi:hypothetical protein